MCLNRKGGGLSQMIFNNSAPRNLLLIVSKSADIVKRLNAGRNLVACYVKRYGFTDALRETEDDNEIMQMFHEAHQFHKNFGYYCDADHLRTKGMKVKQVILRLILKILKFATNFHG